jgi:hypothetical protein
MEGIKQARRAGMLLAAALLAATTAACSSGSSGPGVANASPTASSSSSASPGPSGSGGSGLTQGIAYARCMRSHGVPSFPDPRQGPNGQGYGWVLNAQTNPDSPQFQAAIKSCGPIPNLGAGGGPPPLTAAQQQQYLKWAACIRAHGVPNFKDPTFSGGHAQITTSGGSGAQMSAAMQACKSYLSGIPGGGGTTTGGGQ